MLNDAERMSDPAPATEHDKSPRANASQFFVAGELCRRGYAAVVTMGNTPNTDVLCSNRAGTRFVHIQVKTFVPGESRTCSVGVKAEKPYGPNFFWVLAGIPKPTSKHQDFVYYVIPAADMAKNVKALHQHWLDTPGRDGQPHKQNTIRAVNVSDKPYPVFWNIEQYRGEAGWKRITDVLDEAPGVPAVVG
jgi:hypothetical protein